MLRICSGVGFVRISLKSSLYLHDIEPERIVALPKGHAARSGSVRTGAGAVSHLARRKSRPNFPCPRHHSCAVCTYFR